MEHSMPAEVIIDGMRYYTERDTRTVGVPSNTNGNAGWSVRVAHIVGNTQSNGLFGIQYNAKRNCYYAASSMRKHATALAALLAGIAECAE